MQRRAGAALLAVGGSRSRVIGCVEIAEGFKSPILHSRKAKRFTRHRCTRKCDPPSIHRNALCQCSRLWPDPLAGHLRYATEACLNSADHSCPKPKKGDYALATAARCPNSEFGATVVDSHAKKPNGSFSDRRSVNSEKGSCAPQSRQN